MTSPTTASFQGRPIGAVLFDLDGTLLDTAEDIALALKLALGDRGLPAPEVDQVRRMIGKGAPILVRRASEALSLGLDATAQATVLEGFFAHYGRLQDDDQARAVTYRGVEDGLRRLHAAGLPMAVVTNKQQRFAQSLLARRGLLPMLRLVVGGDTCERRKPDPQPLLFAATQLGADPARTLMVGDSVNDVEAGLAAGMSVACVPYGYNEGKDPRTLPAHAFLDDIGQLPHLLGLPTP